MKKIFLLFFVLALAANIVADFTQSDLLKYISKPLIVLSLFAGYLDATRGNASPLKKWVLLALALSWVGDILLMLPDADGKFFLFGLSSFLLAHIGYIVFFHRLKKMEDIKSRAWPLIVVAVYYAALITLLSPSLGDMKLPVRVYGLVISFMFMLALHMLWLRDKTAGRLLMTGALLFVASDSILAINKFYQPFAGAGPLIMLTYGLAQLLITVGAIRGEKKLLAVSC